MSNCCGMPNTCEKPCFHGGKTSGVDAILAEREQTHGAFRSHAAVSQALKASMRLVNEGRGWDALTARQAEALEMIAHKIARILNGNPNHTDHWADIAGYATLVQRELEGGNG